MEPGHFFTNPVELLILGGVITVMGGIAVKWAWERWFASSSRISEDKCCDIRKVCRAEMLNEFYKFKYEVNKFAETMSVRSKQSSEHLWFYGEKLTRTNALLEALIHINLTLCKGDPKIDCDDLNKILIRQGIDVSDVNWKAEKG